MARGDPGEQSYTPEVSPEVLPRKIIPEVRRTPLVQGIEGLAGAVEKKYTGDVETYAGNELADLRLGMTAQLEQLKANAHPGADGFTQQVFNAFDTAAKKYDLSNPVLARAIGPGLNHLRAQFGIEAMGYEAAAGIKYRADSSRDTVDKLAQIASQHPEQTEDLVGQALKQIRSSRLSPDVELETARYAQSTINSEAVRARIQADPYKTMQSLLTPDNADVAIQGLRPHEREALLSHADAMLHQRVADAERLESMTERNERRDASAALTQMMQKSQSPEGLSMADVLKAAPLFRHEPGALSSAMALASGKTVDTDPHVYLPLFQRAQAGEDVSGEAMAHVGRDISKDDAVRLLSIGDRGLPNAHKEALDTVDGYFKQGLFDKWDLGFNARHQSAKNDMLDWLRAHPQATPQEATSQAVSIALGYNAKVARAVDAFERPRFLVGTMAAPDIDATKRATRQAELDHKISHDEAVRQAAIIMQWSSAIDRARRAPPPKGAQ